MPRLSGAYGFRRVRSQRKSVDWGTMGPSGHTSATHTFLVSGQILAEGCFKVLHDAR